MWKIFIKYDDESECILTGKHEDIPLELAIKYHDRYVVGHRCKVTYQQYPKNKHPSMELIEKIEELQLKMKD